MLHNLISGLLDIVYPKACLSCGKSLRNTAAVDELVCNGCWKSLKLNLPPFCHSCGRQLQRNNFSKNICPSCARRQLHFDRAFSPCAYEGTMKKLIHAFKYKGKEHLGRTLSRPMIDFIKEYRLPIDFVDLIVPVPLHKARLRDREFNQAHVLSRHLGEVFNKEVVPYSLKRHRYTRTQTELPNEQRLLNVLGSFRVENKASVRGKNILLVDDVLTTGATSSEAALALKDSGAGAVFVLTLAN